MASLKKIFDAGVTEDTPNWLAERLTITNYMAAIIAVMAAAFIPITFFNFKGLTALPIIGLVLSVAAPYLNHLRIYTAARYCLLMIPFLLATFHSFLLQDGEPVITSLMILAVAFAGLPLLLFEIREQKQLIGGVILSAACIFLTEPMGEVLVIEADNSVFKEGAISFLVTAFGFLGIAGQLLVLSFRSMVSKKKGRELIKQLNEREVEMQKAKEDLEQTVRNLNQRQEEEELRKWQAEGISGFTNILQSNDELAKMLDESIAFLVRFLKINLGAIYLVDEKKDSVEIRMAAAFAYERKKYIERVWEPGEGLVGQCYYEKKSIYQTEIPEKFIRIKSGMGDIPPRALLVVPLLEFGEVVGFFELASVELMTEAEISFVEQLGETLATTIRTFKNNEKTRALLRESQETSEMLRSQEEEMRQNMEELAATQEEMTRREKEREKLLIESNQKTSYIQLFQAVAAATSQAIDVESATEICLELVCDHMSWPIGHVYFWDEERSILKPSGLWVAGNDDQFDAFRDITDETEFASGVGLPGRVHKTQASAWVRNVQEDENFPRIEQATALNLKAGMAFPVTVMGDVKAVMEFFSYEAMEPDHVLMEVMEQIGTQLSRIYLTKETVRKKEAESFKYLRQISELEETLESYREKFGSLD